MKKLPLYVALDLDEEEKALSVAQQTAPYVEGFKIGPRLYFNSGPELILKLKSYGKVFLDFKFFDIPSTMCSAVQSAFNQGVDKLTIHALSGAESLKKLADLESKLNQKRDFKILAITILTSFSEKNLPPSLQEKPLLSLVESLADLAIKSGLSGLVCAGHEVSFIRKKYPTAYLLTPGIRFSVEQSTGNSHNLGNSKPGSQELSSHNLGSPKTSSQELGIEDQKRVCTPKEALEAGANGLVMGRPIYESSDPATVCTRLQQELDKSIITSG